MVGEVRNWTKVSTDKFLTDEFLKEWRERDDAMAKAADIKVIPAAPTDTVWMLPQRKADETDEEWGRRCVAMKNVGNSE
jgi:hypothetical protein